MEEVWMPIQGFNGNYEVSNTGKVKSVARRVRCRHGYANKGEHLLKLREDKYGYLRAYLYGNKQFKLASVHRLVATAFIPNPDCKNQVNHIDGNKHNNNVENLEWCTNSENHLHAYRIGIKTATRCGKNRKKKVLQINIHSGDVIAEYPSAKEAATAVGLKGNSHIYRCCEGKEKQTRGYCWRYKGETGC